MNTDNVISSVQNPKVKRLLALQQKSSERREAGLFVVEGRREIERCLAAGFEVQTLFCTPEVASVVPQGSYDLYLVTPKVYERMAYRGSTEGMIAEVRTRQWPRCALANGSLPTCR